MNNNYKMYSKRRKTLSQNKAWISFRATFFSKILYHFALQYSLLCIQSSSYYFVLKARKAIPVAGRRGP
jgi:hypothetical protein